MNDTLIGLNEAFLSLYRETVLPVFRYHLIRCGDWQEAQALTRETFRRALPWFNRSLRESDQAVVWLFGIAVWVQANVRRRLDASDSIDDGMRPLQNQVAAFVNASDLSEIWSKLPSRTADALAMFIFAGLSMEATADVVGWSLLDLQTRLAKYVDDQVTQRLLAASLQPIGYFTGRLEIELRELAQSKTGRRRRGAGPAWWRFSYRAGRILGSTGRVIPLAFFIIALLVAVWMLSNPPGPSEAVPTPSLPANLPASQFPWTTDSAILADAQGRIFRLQLFDRQKFEISNQEGLYLPANQGPGSDPKISPDGRWLELVSSLDQSTLLLPLLGDETSRVVSPSPVELSWARDSNTALFVDPGHLTVLRSYSLADDASRILAIFPGSILASAVAPDNLHAAVLYQLPGLANAPIQNELAQVDMFTGEWGVLARFQDPGTLGSRHKLIWTDDGAEIWYPRYQMALRLSDLKLHPLVTAPPYDPTARPTYLNLLLHPSVAQPFLDRFGLQALFLDESDPHNYLLTLGAVAPDDSKVALAYYNALGVTGSLALQQGAMLEDRAWSANFGAIGRIAWVEEAHELLVAEKADRPGRLWWVLARTGQRLELDQDVVLLGTLSSLQRRSLNKAPQISLISGQQTRSRSEKVVVHPGLGIRFSAPSDWNVWTFAEDRLWGSVVVTNFDLQGPFGFASLGPEQALVMISPLAWQDQTPLVEWLDQLVQRSGGLASYTAETVDGLPAYRLDYTLPDQSIETIVLVENDRGVIGISMLPGNSLWVDEFNRLLDSIHFEDTFGQ